MTIVTVQAGICGYVTKISSESEDGMEVTLSIESDCGLVKAMAKELAGELDAFDICLGKHGDGAVHKAAQGKLHPGCPVASGVIKCVEAECSLALPRDAIITVEKQ